MNTRKIFGFAKMGAVLGLLKYFLLQKEEEEEAMAGKEHNNRFLSTEARADLSVLEATLPPHKRACIGNVTAALNAIYSMEQNPRFGINYKAQHARNILEQVLPQTSSADPELEAAVEAIRKQADDSLHNLRLTLMSL